MNIVEFAKSLNLSTGTVSRALNDRPEVSPKTRQMVLQKAEELGFTPNPSARRLVMGHNFLIWLECPYNVHILSDRYLVELARALEEAAGARGYDLLLHLGTRRRDPTEVVSLDGMVVVAAPETTAEDLQRLTARGRTPCVVIMDSDVPDFPAASYICLDTLSGVREALKRLADLGHKQVGYIGSGLAQDRLRTALPQLMRDTGLTWNPDLAIEAGPMQEQGLRVAEELLTRPDPPTALLARTDILASGAVQAAHQLGLRVPEDVSIIGHDDIEVAALVDPPLTTVAIHIASIATAAIEALLATIATPSEPVVQTHGTHLIVRASCGPAPTA